MSDYKPPAGWKLVPVEPTHKMIAAYSAAAEDLIKRHHLSGSYPATWQPVEAGYAAMLAAAPTPPVDENTSQERVRSEAENEHEPVAWRYWNEKSRSWNSTDSAIVAQVMHESGRAVEPLYPHPPPLRMPEPMTEEEVNDRVMSRAADNLLDHIHERGVTSEGVKFYMAAFVRAIEAEVMRRVMEANK